MGNRAVITTADNNEPKDSEKIGIYLHWNGGYDSVSAFLRYCKMQGYRTPESDNYGWARLTQTIANYFNDGLCVGVEATKKLDCNNFDNGTYLITGWEITGRLYYKGTEQNTYKLEEMLNDIDDAQPTNIQLGKEKIAQLLKEDNLNEKIQ